MRDYCRYVNVFQGSGAVNLPKPEGVAAAWHFIKELCGNTMLAAAFPFGKMTCCSYSGGYSAGYGNLKDNYGEPLKCLFEGNRILGFSHLHGSDTGFTGTFYNYAVTTPFYGGLENARTLNHMVNETARPGYYAAEVQETGILGEVTVTKTTVCHRYTFPHANGRISINLSSDGLRMEKTFDPCKAGWLQRCHYGGRRRGGNGQSPRPSTLYFCQTAPGGVLCSTLAGRSGTGSPVIWGGSVQPAF